GPLEDLHILPQLPVLPPQLRQLLPLHAGQAAILAGPSVAFGLLDPLADRGLGQVESLATWPIDRSACWHRPTISALNSGVNERRRQGFFPMLSMLGHPPWAKP